MDRYIFIQNDYIIIYSENDKNITRYDVNPNKMTAKNGIIETDKKLKQLFIKSEKIQ